MIMDFEGTWHHHCFTTLPLHTINTIFEQGIKMHYEQGGPVVEKKRDQWTLGPFSLGKSSPTGKSNKWRVSMPESSPLTPYHPSSHCSVGFLIILPQEGFWDCNLCFFLLQLILGSFFLSLHMLVSSLQMCPLQKNICWPWPLKRAKEYIYILWATREQMKAPWSL